MSTPTETTYFDGWDRGRTLCLSKGPEAVRQWLNEHPREAEPYRQGVRQALRDYLDANGLPQRDPLETA